MPMVGSYKNNKTTIKDLDKAVDTSDKKVVNPIDRLSDDMTKELEREKGVTDYIRNIFND